MAYIDNIEDQLDEISDIDPELEYKEPRDREWEIELSEILLQVALKRINEIGNEEEVFSAYENQLGVW